MSQSEKQRLKCVAAGNKAARSCDSCQRTARWYCAADDAFLCQCCDASVHSANSVSHRHHRLQLRMPSPEAPLPAWLSGFTRKARTPRLHNKAVSPVVPELETSEENTEEKDEKQYLVPIADYCSSASSPDDNYNTDVKPLLTTVQFPHDVSSNSNSNNSSDCLVGLLPSEMDLAEFAADMESLLGGGIDNGSFSMEELGLGDTNCGRQLIKEELDSQNTDGDIELYEEMDLSRETTLDINFDDRGSQTSEDDQEETKAAMTGLRPATQCQSRKKVGLRLDYEALITNHGMVSARFVFTVDEREATPVWAR